MNHPFQAEGLVKRYGRTTALAGVEMTVQTGEVHGFLGPNGAGKTTTIRILLGLVRADAGTARLLGGDPWRDAAELHRRLAYVPGDVSLWPALSGGEVIDLLGRLRGGLDPRRRERLLERFELDPRTKVRAYSKGNRQKVALVAALASDVELLVFDEPTSGLDPLMAEVFMECVAEERRAGRTVLLASHILAEAERLCDRISIIRAGRIVEAGTLAELRHLTRTVVDATLERPPADPAALSAADDVRIEGTRVHCRVDADRLGALLRELADHGVRDLVSRPPTLEELFLRHYRTDREPAPREESTR
ncbi:ATP-binding cassette domain-containing protein [Actinomadura sp. HBU206391]|uniref:ABC transporter ATP-binding protein n=1 Tax=Actinomadura sp. HBU206391 TaxID=2731692 RepID=UPI00164FE06E|nr:ABC transporter ATP-binding protein [Actinomadura sp. HBU206391]MBC6461175.1 ABC transporter ATP-binding protein [Actinomadura sp. HBU206391]